MQLQDLISESTHFDIWRYSRWLPLVASGDRISDHKGVLSPLEQKNEKLWVKHEDDQPLGSHKGRSLALQLSLLKQAGKSQLVLSSSGNAAIACHALTYTDDTVLLVAPTIDQGKLAQLQHSKGRGRIIMTPHARAFAQYLVNKQQYVDLRPSQDQSAIDGLMTLGFELVEQLGDLGDQYSIFSPTTSGGNILGMGKAFQALLSAGILSTVPKIFPVLLKGYHGGTMSEKRLEEVHQLALTTGGQVIEQPLVTSVSTSFEGATAYQAYLDYSQQVDKAVVIFTGRQWPQPLKPITMPQVHTITELMTQIAL